MVATARRAPEPKRAGSGSAILLLSTVSGNVLNPAVLLPLAEQLLHRVRRRGVWVGLQETAEPRGCRLEAPVMRIDNAENIERQRIELEGAALLDLKRRLFGSVELAELKIRRRVEVVHIRDSRVH